jgi:hypothetical protein
MNKLILKQKEKQKEKKKKSIILTNEIIKERLINHFKNHIGEDNKTTKEEIFEIVTGFNVVSFENYMSFYWFERIKKAIRELRSKNICFIILKNGFYFVLKEQDEADYYKKVCDSAISSMENSKIRADNWVENESWKNFNYKQPQKKILNTEEKLDKSLKKAENLKTKVIKLWKGEKNENKDK